LFVLPVGYGIRTERLIYFIFQKASLRGDEEKTDGAAEKVRLKRVLFYPFALKVR
jgi:hypothetical protein